MDKNITKFVGTQYTSNNTCLVNVWSPFSKRVELMLKGHKTPHELTKDTYGYWQKEVKEMKPGTKYMFSLDNELQRPDPASASQPEGVHSWSEVVDHKAYDWEDATWSPRSIAEMIIYELHVGTFTPDGTFEAIIEKLDHLLELGINTIEIMPIAQFPGNRNWGYDGVYPFAVQQSYGGVEKLKQMVDNCHQKGISVILDVVYNHMGPEGNYLSDFGPYFTEKYHTPWGSAINFDDKYSDHVRNFFLQNALMWLEDYHFDGLRLDAVHAIMDNGPVHFLKELRMRVDQLEKKTGKSYCLIAESDMNDVKILNDYSQGGYGLEAQWTDDFHHAVHTLATGERGGYYADYGKIAHLGKSFKQAFIYDGLYSEYRKKTVGNDPSQLPKHKFLVGIQNHDQVGNRMLGERLSQLVSFEMLKLSAGVMLISPFVPMLFMGEEYGEDQPFQYFVSHGDPGLIEAVQEGRKLEFESFQWGGEVPDPQSISTFNASKLKWNFKEDIPKGILFKYYQQLIHLRKEGSFTAFIDKNINIVTHEQENMLSIFAGKDNREIITVFNFSHKEQKISLPEKDQSWSKIIASADLHWSGPQDMLETVYSGEELAIPSTSLVIYKK
ncbi:MAG: malto-oligosyltrehalose trehalohydrolase [Anditalea sp.]